MSEQQKKKPNKKKAGLLIFFGIILILTLVAAIVWLRNSGGQNNTQDGSKHSLDTVSGIISIGSMFTFVAGCFMLWGGIDELMPHDDKPAEKRHKPQVVKAKLMSVDGVNVTTRSGTVSGALLGGLIGGGVGAVVGGMANTKDHISNVDTKYTFLVLYDNGKQELETLSGRWDKKRLELLVSKIDINEA